MPEPIFDIHNCEDLCSMEACRNVLNGRKLIIFYLYCTIQIFGVKTYVQLSILLGTARMELIHLVGVVTGATTSCASKSSNASLSLGLNVTAMRRGACCTGGNSFV